MVMTRSGRETEPDQERLNAMQALGEENLPSDEEDYDFEAEPDSEESSTTPEHEAGSNPQREEGRQEESRTETPQPEGSQIQGLKKEIDELKKLVRQLVSKSHADNTVDQGVKEPKKPEKEESRAEPRDPVSEEIRHLLGKTHSPFVRAIREEKIPDKISFPKMDPYDGTTDPGDYLSHYQSTMALVNGCSDAMMCRAFIRGLRGAASTWFLKLEPESISSFTDLSEKFVRRFVASRRLEKGPRYLMSIRQGKDESLRDYISRFSAEATQVTDCDDRLISIALASGLKPGRFQDYLTLEKTFTLPELLDKARAYIILEETKRAEKETELSSRKKTQESQRDTGKRKAEERGGRGTDSRYPKKERKEAGALDLTAPLGVILHKIKDREELRFPGPIFAPLSARDKSKYCEFHKDYGHTTDRCRNLQFELERLVKQGRLKEFLREGRSRGPSPRRDRGEGSDRDERRDKGKAPANVIYVVHAESEAEGSSRRARKRSIQELKEPVLVAQKEEFRATMSFTEEDAAHVRLPHGDALVITAMVGNFEVRRLLVDTGCSTNIIFAATLKKMGVEKKKIEPSRSVMVGFNGEKSEAEGKISLPVTSGDGRESKTIMAEFQILGTPSPYNAILGRAWIHEMRAVTSTFHQCLKFVINGRQVTIRGDQVAARECHAVALK